MCWGGVTWPCWGGGGTTTTAAGVWPFVVVFRFIGGFIQHNKRLLVSHVYGLMSLCRDHPCHGVVGGERQLVLLRHSGNVQAGWGELVVWAGDRLQAVIGFAHTFLKQKLGITNFGTADFTLDFLSLIFERRGAELEHGKTWPAMLLGCHGTPEPAWWRSWPDLTHTKVINLKLNNIFVTVSNQFKCIFVQRNCVGRGSMENDSERRNQDDYGDL